MEEQRTDPPADSALQRTAADAAPWLKYYDSGVPHSIEYRDIPLYTWLDEAADRHPLKPACRFHNTRITYAALRRDAEILAANLHSHGVAPGDRVGIMLPNLPQTVIAFWGVLKAGGIVTMINPLYMEKELVHQVKDSGLRHLVALDLLWPKFAKLRDKLRLEKYFITCVSDGLAFPLNWMQRFKSWRDKSVPAVPYDGRQVFAFSDLLRGSRRLSQPIPKPRETVALLQYTGGTTGLSKGAMLSHANVGANIQQIQATIKILSQQDHVFMAVLPFFHVYGLTTCLALPAAINAMVVTAARFVPAELLAALEKYKCTALPGAPSIYISLLQQKNKSRYPLQKLKLCISGSAPIPVETMRRFENDYGAKIAEGYGLSEASPITHLTPMEGLRKAGSIGLPLPDTEARIVDMELGHVALAPGKVGELIVRGPQVMLGYWNNPDETANVLRNGWLYTGDIATMDEEGFFYIVDRKKDMIIVGGYNVAPREIDEVLYEHPKVREAVSVGVSHPTRGEVIKAYIVLKEGESCERSEIVSWCRERLANYKVPRMVEFRDELPKTLVGKILRRVLRAEEESRNKEREAAGCDPSLDAEPFFNESGREEQSGNAKAGTAAPVADRDEKPDRNQNRDQEQSPDQ
ncbi:long-chain fatty acid--CoA ligase, partial [Desulfovibrio sp. OttesenSCG-928-G11]|nr:long-chain fatty acid--CoA ligase [Desulfovibrio sp. OttesenSCG-928-G11]